jgi:hypothetical protein
VRDLSLLGLGRIRDHPRKSAANAFSVFAYRRIIRLTEAPIGVRIQRHRFRRQRACGIFLCGNAFTGKLVVDAAGSACKPSSTAEAYVFNATVIPSGDLEYLTLWQDPEAQPAVSTLNAQDGATTSNMAIVPNGDGKTDAYAGNGTTQLILDISAYFAP